MSEAPDTRARPEPLVSPGEAGLPRRPRGRSRRHDAALLLPLVGLLLLMPPFAGFFTRPEQVFGVPMIVVYLFGVWLMLIGVAFWLSRLLIRGKQPDEPAG